MKSLKVLFLTLVLVLFSFGIGNAGHLTCDNYLTTAGEVPDYFMVVMDGATAVQSTAYAVTGGVTLWYDISSLSVGTHVASAMACTNTTSTSLGNCTPYSANFTFAVRGLLRNLTGVTLSGK